MRSLKEVLFCVTFGIIWHRNLRAIWRMQRQLPVNGACIADVGYALANDRSVFRDGLEEDTRRNTDVKPEIPRRR